MLSLIELTKAFPGCFEPTLKSIHLSLAAGDFCIVIGSNGSGKTTLMRLISGEYTPTHGEILLADKPLSQAINTQIIASVVQDVNQGTIADMTLLENMVLSITRGKRASLKAYQRYREQIIAYVSDLQIGLEQYIDTPLRYLSGGQRQMVAMLMAVHANPNLLLLDEHTSALDPKMQACLMNYTAAAIAEKQLTTLMITHRLDDAIAYGNRLVMLHQGRIVLNVSGPEKAALTVPTLLALFHQYEDLTLTKKDAS